MPLEYKQVDSNKKKQNTDASTFKAEIYIHVESYGQDQSVD